MSTTVARLIEKYGNWGEHPLYSHHEWLHQASREVAQQGYWYWVAIKINQAKTIPKETKK